VLTGADIAGALGDLATRAMEGEWQVELMRGPEQPVLARDKVCYVGQPMAVVAARDRYVARDAVDLIQVDYEPLPPILDPLEAAREDSNPNGIQLGSKCVLYQGLAQQTSWFAHKREGFGPPLFDSGLDAVRTYGIDEQELQQHAGVRGPEPP
jgi:CO/xanthine dehydrogenase Mo-binding subunit